MAAILQYEQYTWDPKETTEYEQYDKEEDQTRHMLVSQNPQAMACTPEKKSKIWEGRI